MTETIYPPGDGAAGDIRHLTAYGAEFRATLARVKAARAAACTCRDSSDGQGPILDATCTVHGGPQWPNTEGAA